MEYRKYLGVPWPDTVFCILRIPFKCHSRYTISTLFETIADLSPFPIFYLRYYGFHGGHVPKIHVANVIKSEYFAYATAALVDGYMEFLRVDDRY